ncbi:DUF5667 domain-containing protein [Planomicrobium sp. MB-3u-38]|uniref:DUF5667 domain-containing protein n=1 Tax=Planomicrobium sp. MB-3u-38 TaxID=2058318 RepID=UPI000C79DB3E|nr:DUF5667 domain-containing protein [Planomicrobium sp. MB-3u-38]PKH10099.1 hypothetical protein CXF70_12905 [Planomicrobium sp. MB-3u-38]
MLSKSKKEQVSKQIKRYFAVGVIASAGMLSLNALAASADEHSPAAEENATDTTVAEEPALVPGDFFYFLKQLQETVQLAFTFDQAAEAELFAEYAEQRILEAEALMAAGDEELAVQTLEKALALYEEGLDQLVDGDEDEKEEPPADEPDGEELPAEEAEEEPVDMGSETDEDLTEEDARAALEAKFSSSLLALQAAMEKVTNPQAKESLAKNVAKAMERLDRKVAKELAKLEESDEEAEEPSEEEVVPEEDTVEEPETPEEPVENESAETEEAAELPEDEVTDEESGTVPPPSEEPDAEDDVNEEQDAAAKAVKAEEKAAEKAEQDAAKENPKEKKDKKD